MTQQSHQRVNKGVGGGYLRVHVCVPNTAKQEGRLFLVARNLRHASSASRGGQEHPAQRARACWRCRRSPPGGHPWRVHAGCHTGPHQHSSCSQLHKSSAGALGKAATQGLGHRNGALGEGQGWVQGHGHCGFWMPLLAALAETFRSLPHGTHGCQGPGNGQERPEVCDRAAVPVRA